LGRGVSHWDYGRHFDCWKYHWGLFFAFLYFVGIIAFIRNVWKTWSPDITYNWLGVMVSFLTVGLAIYLIFIVQF
jgi:hypothetical protein